MTYQTQKATSEDVALIALAGSTGLEPATSDVTGRRSNQTELTPQAGVRVCFRSRALRGLVYTEVCPARNNFFEKIFRSLREGLRRWGRGLSLLLYSPAQDGKHIKCFPLRAELATNLTPAPSAGDPPCRHIIQPVLRACAAARLARVLPGGVGLIVLVGLLYFGSKKNGRCVVHPPFLLRLVQVNKLGA